MPRELLGEERYTLARTIADKARLIYRPFSPREVNVPISGMHRGSSASASDYRFAPSTVSGGDLPS